MIDVTLQEISFLILNLLGIALAGAMILFTLLIGGEHRLNRRFVLVLTTYLLGNCLLIPLWPYRLTSADPPPATVMALLRATGVLLIAGMYGGLLFAETLFSERGWWRQVRRVLGVAAVILSIAILVVAPRIERASEGLLALFQTWTPVTQGILIYMVANVVAIAGLVWQNRQDLPDHLLIVGLILFVTSAMLLPTVGTQSPGLPILVGVIACTITSVTLARSQIMKPLERERAQISFERDQLLRLHDTAATLQQDSDTQQFFKLVTEGFCRLGWNRVAFRSFLENDPITVVEPENLDDPEHPPQIVCSDSWWNVWQTKTASEQERFRLGKGYFIPQSAPAGTLHWQSRDILLIPLKMHTGRPLALISLSDPVSKLRPTDHTMQTLGILASHVQSNLENKLLFVDLQAVTDQLIQQVEELMMMQRVDSELNATLDFESVMSLALDWAMRRTGAIAGVLYMANREDTALEVVALSGYPDDALASNVVSLTEGIIGRAVRTHEMQEVPDTTVDPDYIPVLKETRSLVCLPLEVRRRVIGVISLESDRPNAFTSAELSFIKRFAVRASAAVDNARLYRDAEARGDEMSMLYSAGRTISSSIERKEVLRNSAQALSASLGVSGGILLEFLQNRELLSVVTTYRLGTARRTTDILPQLDTILDLVGFPELKEAIENQRPLVIQESDAPQDSSKRALLEQFNCKALLALPMVAQREVIGVALAVEGRRARTFFSNEVLMAEAVVGQIALALRQAQLYEDVRELESIKSDMIRMASHDLRNPLGNAMAYFELLAGSIKNSMTDLQVEYIDSVRRSNNTIKTLIEDLLNLEKVQSEQKTAWKELDFGELVWSVFDTQRSAADLKQQTFTLSIAAVDEGGYNVQGSSTQLRQAVTNFVNNSVKYTPEGGKIEVKLMRRGSQLIFEVTDNGYGISKERQARLFQRFYRAREAGTDHIPGTGLGLNLVKTVVERHGGEVWCLSELGQGSTFGLWLPFVPKHVNKPSETPQPSTDDSLQAKT